MMGSQVSTIKAVLAPDGKRKGIRLEHGRIEILSFEVANIMSRILLLWQSLSEPEVLRLRTDVIKAEGVLNLVSDSEAVLLSLACMEKLQDLTAVAGAIAQLGKRCQEPLLQGFEHVYSDILKQKIDIHSWEFSLKDMEGKIKKMEHYIALTSNLYQELEILGDLEVAIRRMQDDGSGISRDRGTLAALEEKVGWHRQEIKYLQDLSLWNQTYDKVVGLLARAVCTIHGRILTVFGSPLLGLPQLWPTERLQDIHPLKCGTALFSNLGYLNHTYVPVIVGPHTPQDYTFVNGTVTNTVNSSHVSSVSPKVSDVRFLKHEVIHSRSMISQNKKPHSCYLPLYQNCLHSSRESMDFQAISFGNSYENITGMLSKVEEGAPPPFEESHKSALSCPQPILHRVPFKTPCHFQTVQFPKKCYKNTIIFDPKSMHHNAPSSTLGGAALALHYANVVIIIEKMIRFPHLISLDSRDDLYHMLPSSVRIGLRSRLKATSRREDGFDSGIAGDWKEALERILAWLTPLAHNMIRWQSEHNFEQQQVVARTNMLLLQTLYFADVLKTEAAITELLVGLNYICGHEKEKSNMSIAAYDSQKEVEYLEWQF